MACCRLTPAVRRVNARTRLVNRASACGAIRRRGSASLVTLKPRNLRASGRATDALGGVDLQLETAGQELLDAGHDPPELVEGPPPAGSAHRSGSAHRYCSRRPPGSRFACPEDRLRGRRGGPGAIFRWPALPASGSTA